MRLISFDGQAPFVKHVLVDLEWMTASAKDFKSVRAELKSNNKEWLTLPSSNSATKEMLNYGVVDQSALPKQGHSISLAAWLAHSFRQGSILAVEEIEDKQQGTPAYWLCLINDGQVLAGTDIVLDDWETVEEMAQGSVDALGDDELGYVGSATHQLSFVDAEEPYPALADVLTRAVAKKARFTNSEGNRLVTLVALAVVATTLVGGGAWYAVDAYLESEAIAERQERKRERQIRRAKNEYQQILTEVGQKANAGITALNLWATVLHETQTKISGWELQGAECKGSQCAIEYRNTDLTLPRVLRKSLGGFCNEIQVDPEGLVATCTRTYQVEPIAQPQNGAMVTEDQIASVLLSEEDVNELQAGFMTVAKIADGTAYAVNEAAAYPFSGSRWLPQARVFEQGEWGLAFPIKYYRSVSNMLNRFRGVALEEASLNWSSRSIELRGIYVTGEENQNEG